MTERSEKLSGVLILALFLALSAAPALAQVEEQDAPEADAPQDITPQAVAPRPPVQRALARRVPPVPQPRPADADEAAAAPQDAAPALAAPVMAVPAQAPVAATPAAAEPPPYVFDPPYGKRQTDMTPGRPQPVGEFPSGRDAYTGLLRRHAQEADVPFDLADAVVAVESGYDPAALGDDDRIGLMQVSPATLRDFNFFAPLAEAFTPDANLRLGMAYLSGAWKLSSGRICETLSRYHFGWTRAQAMPDSETYCRRVLIRLAANGSPLGADIQLPGLVEARAALKAKPRQDWADHDKKVKDIDKKFGGEKFGILSE